MERTKRSYTKGKFRERPGQVVRIAGQRFGALTVISRAGRIGKHAAWLCRCDCGAERVLPGIRLRRGRLKACGVNGHRYKAPREPTLREQFPSEYWSWESMRRRCMTEKHKGFPNYGGRGIRVCERWESFQNFMLDMGRKPDPSFTIEREDVNGNYEPGNCKWLPRNEMHRNRRNSVFVTYRGKRMYLLDVVNELGLSRNIVYNRMKLGWPLDVALAIPVRTHKK